MTVSQQFTLPDEEMQQYYHMFSLQMGPEMEQRIQTEIEKRCHSIFAEHAEQMETLQKKLAVELEKNKDLSAKLERAEEESRYLFQQVNQLYIGTMAQRNGETVKQEDKVVAPSSCLIS